MMENMNKMTVLVVFFLIPVLVNSLPLGPLDQFSEGVGNLSRGVNHLSKNLFKILSSESDNSNVVISPFSIHTAMSMLYQGSRGDTKTQLQAALGVKNADLEKLLEENKNLLSNYGDMNPPWNVNMNESLNIELEVANSLFADDSFEIKEDYQRLLEEFYLTKVQTVDFEDSSKTVDTINEWVKNKTNNLIDSLVDSVSSETRMLLLNAVYFKANWAVPFLKELTSKRSFHVSPTKSVETDFMFLETTAEFASLDHLKADVISLPYENKNYRMLIFLPHEGSSVENLETDQFDSILNSIDEVMFEQAILLRMPKFKIDYSKSLVKSFQQLGVTAAFEDADLGGISDEPLYVSDIVHKATVEVTEEGSEAAAVTGIFIQARSGILEAVMDVNRPFKFVIQDKTHNIPLFVGKISDPTNDKASVEHATEESEEKEIMNDTKELIADIEKHETTINVDVEEEEETKEIIVDTAEIDTEATPVNETTEINVLDDEDFRLVPRSGDVPSKVGLNEDPQFFPLNNKDTDPILNYKTKFGDGSIYGNFGELANNSNRKEGQLSIEDNNVDQYEGEVPDYDYDMRQNNEDYSDIFEEESIDIFAIEDYNNSVEESFNEESFENDIFPENNQDTDPILYYKNKFGDGSVYGNRGELATQLKNQLS